MKGRTRTLWTGRKWDTRIVIAEIKKRIGGKYYILVYCFACKEVKRLDKHERPCPCRTVESRTRFLMHDKTIEANTAKLKQMRREAALTKPRRGIEGHVLDNILTNRHAPDGSIEGWKTPNEGEV